MKRTLCVVTVDCFKCGSCTTEMEIRPKEPYCLSCEVKWFYILPAFLYFALQHTPCDVREEHEDFCYTLANELGDLGYVPHSGLANLCRQSGYALDVPWTIV